MNFCHEYIADIAAQIKTGKTPPTAVDEYFNGDINWYTPTDLSRETYLGKSSRTITEKAMADKKAVVFEKDTVLVSCIGDIGKIGIVADRASSNQQITGIKLGKKVLPLFFYYWCKRNKKLLSDNSRTAVVPILNNETLGKIKISFPENLDDQIRIATVLTRAEKLIAKRKESIKALDELLKSTFLEMFGDINNPKYKTDRIDKYSLKITDGTHQSPEFVSEGVPFLLVSNIVNNEIWYKTKKYISEKEYEELNKRTPIEHGDLLFTSVGSYGNAALVRTNTRFAFQRHIAYIKPDINKINPVFLFGAMMSEFVKKQVDRFVHGVAQLTLNLSDLKRIEVPIPPKILQDKYAIIIDKHIIVKTHYVQTLLELENLYNILSQRAFKGELDLGKIA